MAEPNQYPAPSISFSPTLYFARILVLSASPRLSLSGSYGTVVREVLAESVMTANDPFKQFAISFFDNKFNSLVPLKIAYFLR